MKNPQHAPPLEHGIFLNGDCCKVTLLSSGNLGITRSLLGIAESIVFACRSRERRPTLASKHGSRGGKVAMPFSIWHVYPWRLPSKSFPVGLLQHSPIGNPS